MNSTASTASPCVNIGPLRALGFAYSARDAAPPPSDRCTHGAGHPMPPAPARPPVASAIANHPLHNQLLAALPEAELQRWRPYLESVDLPQGTLLYGAGRSTTHVYFPTTAVVSLAYLLEDGSSADVAQVGHEGMVGMSHFMGGGSMITQAIVQSAGQGFRMRAEHLVNAFGRGGPVLNLLLRYTQALITQIAQTAVCNRHHTLDQQLCRWLLRSLDLAGANELVMTHEMIASMLGVRREGVTAAAGQLSKAGLISYRRGHIAVLDRHGLEQRSCECYAVAKREQDRLLPACTLSLSAA